MYYWNQIMLNDFVYNHNIINMQRRIFFKQILNHDLNKSYNFIAVV